MGRAALAVCVCVSKYKAMRQSDARIAAVTAAGRCLRRAWICAMKLMNVPSRTSRIPASGGSYLVS